MSISAKLRTACHSNQLTLSQRALLDELQAKSFLHLKERTMLIYLRAMRVFLFHSGLCGNDFSKLENIYIDSSLIRSFETHINDTFKIGNLTNTIYIVVTALRHFFAKSIDEGALCTLAQRYPRKPTFKRHDAITVHAANLPTTDDRSFHDWLLKKYGYHRADDYRRLLGYIAKIDSAIIFTPLAERFQENFLKSIIDKLLLKFDNLHKLQRFHLIGTALNLYFANDLYTWIYDSFRQRRNFLKLSLTIRFENPATSDGVGSIDLLTIHDMRTGFLQELMERIAPTATSVTRIGSKAKRLKESSRNLIEHDLLELLNSRIAYKIGAPDDPIDVIFDSRSVKSVCEYLSDRWSQRSIGRLLGRLRWIRARCIVNYEDQTQLLLRIISSRLFRNEPRRIRYVDHIDHELCLTILKKEVERFLLRVHNDQCRIRSYEFIEWRCLLILGIFITTGLRRKNVLELRFEWFETTGQHTILRIPGVSMKNGHPFVLFIPNWLFLSIQKYKSLQTHHNPNGQIWLSRDGDPLTLTTFERSVKQSSLRLFGEALRPHDYRRLRAKSLQTCPRTNPMSVHIILGHRSAETTFLRYPTRIKPDFQSILRKTLNI